MGRWRLAVGLLSAGLFWTAPSAVAPVDQEPGEATLSTDLVERAEISLILLDVEVRDEAGHPLPGLTKDDFTVLLNGRARPIYSLDDLCLPRPSVARAREEGTADPAAGDSVLPESAPDISPSAIRDFILYLDFGQMKQDGRVAALDAAESWVRETLQPGERAQLVGHTWRNGIRLLTDFTRDRGELLAAVERARTDMNLVDPFPVTAEARVFCCSGIGTGPCIYPEPLPCSAWAAEELSHARLGMEALRSFLTSLATVPGRKALILFHQDGSIYPSRKYAISEVAVGDQVRLLDEVGAEATLSHTVIYPMYTGDSLSGLASTSVNFGANLADFTGGEYNRGDVDLARATARAGREFSCLYRIGLVRPDAKKGNRIYRAKVMVHNRSLAGRYRVRFLDEVDRWWRQAQAILSSPERVTDVPLRTTLVPLAANEKGWNLTIRVAVEMQSLMLVPGTQRQRGGWEVGVLLSRDRGRKNWEMLGVSQVQVGQDLPSGILVVHERVIKDVSAGSYRLAAFARDRIANLFGGDDATLVLSDPRQPGVVGPVVMLSARKYLKATLPLMKQGRSISPARATVRHGLVPATGESIQAGEALKMLTWLCPGKEAPPPQDVQRYITRDGEALFRLGEEKIEPAGRCFRLADLVNTAPMEPGRYDYHLRWKFAEGSEPLERSVSFEVVPGDRSSLEETSAGS